MKDIRDAYYLYNGEVKPVSGFDDLTLRKSPVYEVIRVTSGVPLFIGEHIDRIRNSFRLCSKETPYTDEEIREEIRKLIRINSIGEGAVKLFFIEDNGSTDLLAYSMIPYMPTQEEYEHGIRTVTMQEERSNPNAKIWSWALRKTSVNHLKKHNAFETILVNREGCITEGSRSNIFFIRAKSVVTTPATDILPGITRKKVMQICSNHGIPLTEKKVHLNELTAFDAAFMSGTTRKIAPVKQIDAIPFDPHHPELRRIMELFRKTVEEYVEKHSSIQ